MNVTVWSTIAGFQSYPNCYVCDANRGLLIKKDSGEVIAVYSRNSWELYRLHCTERDNGEDNQ